MISQGFPLWAVESDGTAYAVVGWTESAPGNITYPSLVPLDGRVRGAVVGDSDGGVYRYTTADPSAPAAGPQTWPILESAAERNLTDLRARMANLADELDMEYGGPTGVAARIRRELNR